jgi:aspartate aminotransferase-like enzyme
VLSNGEFGERLIDHARRWRLQFEVMRADWGQGFDPAALRAAFARTRPRWLWLVACETSTGVQNPLALPRELCLAHGSDLCIDAVSAVGLTDINLRGARFVSAVSGKALGAYPGLAIVAHNHDLVPAGEVPRYLDLAAYREADGVPYTQSSNLLAALNVALAVDWPQRWQQVHAADEQLRGRLHDLGFAIVADNAVAMPGVISLALPASVSAARVAQGMARSGYLLAHRSDYLVQRNWLQICLMGAWDHSALQILPEVLARQVQARHVQARTAQPGVQGHAA